MISVLSRGRRHIVLALVCVFSVVTTARAQPSNYPDGKQVRLVAPDAPWLGDALVQQRFKAEVSDMLGIKALAKVQDVLDDLWSEIRHLLRAA